MIAIREAYQALTVDDVRAVFNKYYTPARTFRVIVTPKATVAENAPAEAAGASGT